MNNNPILMQQLLQGLYSQQANQNISPMQYFDNTLLAYSNPAVQDRFNKLERKDATLQDKNLNYIPTTEQINKMLRQYGIPTTDLYEAQDIRNRYNKITGQNL